MPHALRAALLLCLLVPARAGASTFAFAGKIDHVNDGSNFLNASVVAGTAVTGTYDVVPTSADTSSPFEVGHAHLSFQLGDYRFDASQDAHTIALINDTGPPGATIDLWQSGTFTVPDLSPPSTSSGSFAGYAVRIEFFDNTSSKLDGTETQPFVPADLSGWSLGRLILDSLASNGAGSTSIDDRVQIQVDFKDWQPVPEPRSAALFALGLASLALRARRPRAARSRR
jgi:hypothetical protein